MRNFLATLAVLAILLGVGFYAAGWLKYQKDGTGATIEIKTQKIEDAASKAVDDGKELLDDVIDQSPRRVDRETPVVVEDPVVVPAEPVVP